VTRGSLTAVGLGGVGPGSILLVTGRGSIVAIARRRANWFIRDLVPRRKVVRDVQGVRMVLPWSHRLPDYAAAGAKYGQNLVALARLLAETGPLTVMDIGANVGDSALQILHAADGKVLCVEGDTAYLEFLHLNVDDDDRIAVVEALLAVDDSSERTTAVRTGGTTRFVSGTAADAMPSVTPAALRAQFPEFANLRLVKSDTDGYDVSLVPAVAREWAHVHPVLFFEYHPYLTRLAGLDPLAVWPQLQDLGYTDIAVWDNGGTPIGRMTHANISDRAAVLDDFTGRPAAAPYWDVALVHADDDLGRAALDQLIPG
jgi:FkbM family methyltransferase